MYIIKCDADAAAVSGLKINNPIICIKYRRVRLCVPTVALSRKFDGVVEAHTIQVYAKEYLYYIAGIIIYDSDTYANIPM